LPVKLRNRPYRFSQETDFGVVFRHAIPSVTPPEISPHAVLAAANSASCRSLPVALRHSVAPLNSTQTSQLTAVDDIVM